MAKKNKRTADHGAGDSEGWEWSPVQLGLALMPYRIGAKPVAPGTGPNGLDFEGKIETGTAKLVDIGADAEELKLVYEALLRHGIPPELRRALLHALGREPQAENANYTRGQTIALEYLVDQVEARMRAAGERPRGLRTAAIQEVAEAAGMEPKTLQERFVRLKDDHTI